MPMPLRLLRFLLRSEVCLLLFWTGGFADKRSIDDLFMVFGTIEAVAGFLYPEVGAIVEGSIHTVPIIYFQLFLGGSQFSL